MVWITYTLSKTQPRELHVQIGNKFSNFALLYQNKLEQGLTMKVCFIYYVFVEREKKTQFMYILYFLLMQVSLPH